MDHRARLRQQGKASGTLSKFEPYQLNDKAKRKDDLVKETTIYDPKKLKRMKRDLGELNRKVRHSRKKLDNLIRRSDNLKKTIDEMMKASSTKEPPQHKFELKDLAEVFGCAYRSYRVDGKPKIDPDTFYELIKKGLIDLITRELKDLKSARILTTTWIRFRKDDELVELAFYSQMKDSFEGSDFDQLVDEMIKPHEGTN